MKFSFKTTIKVPPSEKTTEVETKFEFDTDLFNEVEIEETEVHSMTEVSNATDEPENEESDDPHVIQVEESLPYSMGFTATKKRREKEKNKQTKK